VDERNFFLLLLGVNGVGPRMALGILAILSVDAIRRAVQNEQPEIFGRVPGVGKKTGQKIILHLQGKLAKAWYLRECR
jgi:holliday junction DNA helicase RuvA